MYDELGKKSDLNEELLYRLNSIAAEPAQLKKYLAGQLEEDDDDDDVDEWDIGGEEDADIGSGSEVEDEDLGARDDQRDSNDAKSNSSTNTNKPSSSSSSTGPSSATRFHSEMRETLRRGEVEKLDVDSVVLELAGLKLSHDSTIVEYSHAFFEALFELILPARDDRETLVAKVDKTVLGSLGNLLKRWCIALTKFGRLETDQVFLIQGLALACTCYGIDLEEKKNKTHVYSSLFTPVLQLLYNNFDALGQESILAWVEQAQSKAASGEKLDYALLIKQSAQFVEWLQEDEEEDEDEEDDD